MDPNVESADEKLQQADQIDQTAAQVRNDGTTDAATQLETTASDLRAEAEQEKVDAQTQAEQEKAEVDQKYGTT